jgi:hypothetical protein
MTTAASPALSQGPPGPERGKAPLWQERGPCRTGTVEMEHSTRRAAVVKHIRGEREVAL